MTFEIVLVLIIMVCALVLFASEKLPLDIVALLLLVTLIAIPLIFGDLTFFAERGIDLKSAFPTVAEGLSGLSNPATITVLCLFILSAGIQRTGLIRDLGKRLLPLVGNSEVRQLLAIALIAAPISGLINNTAMVAVMIPMVMRMAQQSGRSPGKLLIPLSFFGQLGGMLTLVGTSTNLLAAAILSDPQQGTGKVIGMFEFIHIGAIVMITGVLYFVIIGRHLLPQKDVAGRKSLVESEGTFLFEIRIPEGSKLIGQVVGGSRFLEQHTSEIMRLLRGDRSFVKSAGKQTITAGDQIQLRAKSQQILELSQSDHVQILAGGYGLRRAADTRSRMVRVLLRSARVFHGKRIGGINFRERFNAPIVGVEKESLNAARFVDHTLRTGDIVLVATSEKGIHALGHHDDLIVLDLLEDAYQRDKQGAALVIMSLVVALPAITGVPILVTALAGVILMVTTGVLAHDEAYQSVRWKVIFLLAGVIPMGIAMVKSGAASWVAQGFVTMTGTWHPLLVLMSLYLLTTLLTELVSNNAAAVILVPVAISIGVQTGLATFPLVLVVMFAASTSFLSPVGYQTNAMVYGSGYYRYLDFAKAGGLLNLLLIAITCLAIYRFFPLY